MSVKQLNFALACHNARKHSKNCESHKQINQDRFHCCEIHAIRQYRNSPFQKDKPFDFVHGTD